MGQRKKELIALKGAGLRKGGKPAKPTSTFAIKHLVSYPVRFEREHKHNPSKTSTDPAYKAFMNSLITVQNG